MDEGSGAKASVESAPAVQLISGVKALIHSTPHDLGINSVGPDAVRGP